LETELGIEELEGAVTQQRRAEELVQQGLGNRAHLVRVVNRDVCTTWGLNDECPTSTMIEMGILFNSDNCFRLVDKGPSADDESAKSFRKFWGDKSELRGFQDGAIVEAVVWQEAAERVNLIPQLVVRHVLERHMEIEPDEVIFTSTSTEPALEQIGTKDSVLNAAPTQRFIAAFDELVKEMKALPNLPLAITDVTAVSPAFRHTDVFPPVAHPLAQGKAEPKQKERHSRCAPVYEAIITFENSSKWADDIVAVQKLRGAFYAHLANSLEKKAKLSCRTSQGWIRVISQGFVFQFRIAYPRELALRRIAKDSPEEILQCELDFEFRPKLARSLHGLQMKYPAFGPTVRLAQRWLHAHLFSGKFEPEVVELMVAFLFVSPGPFSVPATATVGLVRFLKLLARYDWSKQPLVVDVNGELTADSVAQVQAAFETLSEKGNNPPLFIATAHDPTRSVWTQTQPTAQTFQRMVALASKAAAWLCELPTVEAFNLGSWPSTATIFQNDFSNFDVLIRIARSAIPRWAQTLQGSSKPPPRGKFSMSQYKNLQIDVDGLYLDFDPIGKFVEALEENFGDIALFFYDQLGGGVVAVVWKPAAFMPRNFRVTDAQHALPLEVKGIKGVQTVPNIVSVLADFRSLGEGLVESVEMASA